MNVNAITLDNELRARLNGLDQQLMFTDENGNPVGFFLPAQDYRKLMLNSMQIPLSEEEIQKRRKEKTGSSLQEIWDRLGAK
jgi:hypothetical protein